MRLNNKEQKMKMGNERAANVALTISKQLWSGNGCALCNNCNSQMHHLAGIQFNRYLGASNAILGLTLVPVCEICHITIEKESLIDQIKIVQNCTQIELLKELQAYQIEAMKSQIK